MFTGITVHIITMMKSYAIYLLISCLREMFIGTKNLFNGTTEWNDYFHVI